MYFYFIIFFRSTSADATMDETALSTVFKRGLFGANRTYAQVQQASRQWLMSNSTDLQERMQLAGEGGTGSELVDYVDSDVECLYNEEEGVKEEPVVGENADK